MIEITGIGVSLSRHDDHNIFTFTLKYQNPLLAPSLKIVLSL